jgi:hypothetical protein
LARKQLIEVTAMSTFQKIAIGLLGLTHPEMFIPICKPTQQSSQKSELSSGHSPAESVQLRESAARVIRALRFMLAALAVGSRTVSLADNSQLSRDLGARARHLYGSNED